MAKHSAGILLYRFSAGVPEVLLVHPGGPLWAKRDLGAWSIPKGEHAEAEDPLACALREFEEELGVRPPAGAPMELGAIRQRSGKVVTAWAIEGDLDAGAARSNTFTIEWPPRSGSRRSSRRSTARPGSPSTRRARSCSRRRPGCSTGSSSASRRDPPRP